jgi:hypothetical protein
MGAGASTVNVASSPPPSPPRSPSPTGSVDGAQAVATVARLVLLPAGDAIPGIQMGPNIGVGMLKGTPPVITALKEGSRAFDSRAFVLGDRISHINPSLCGGCRPALDILGDAVAVESELSRLQGDVIANVWVRRAARAAPVVRKPPGGIFGLAFVTVLSDGKERLFVKNTLPGSAAHMCGGLPPGCRIIAVCGTATNSSTVAAQLLGELLVGEVATFEVDHTHWYDGAIHWWPNRDGATPKLATATDSGEPFASDAACRSQKPYSGKKMPVVQLVCELGDRV